jgi:hypothetical protein
VPLTILVLVNTVGVETNKLPTKLFAIAFSNIELPFASNSVTSF